MYFTHILKIFCFNLFVNLVKNVVKLHLRRLDKMVKKNKFCNLIYTCLARGIAGLYKKDSNIKKEIDSLPDGFKINLGILASGNYIGLIKTNNGLFIQKNGFETADLNVYFKNVKATKRVMLARQSVAQSYSRHELIVGGDIARAMVLVRIINRVECYLFPRFMTKNILPKIKKQTCTIGVYMKVLFCSYKYKKGSK